MEDLAEAFRVVMADRGWSASRLARELGTSQPWVSMVLSGKRDPGTRRAAALLKTAGWELALVPSGDDDPMKRRNFLMAAATVALVPGSGPTNPYTSATYVDGLAARLAAHEAQLGGAPLAREAARHASKVIPVARAGSPALQAAASRLCHQSALILHDVRQLGQAETTARAALSLGLAAGDVPASASACDVLSMTTAHLPDGRGARYAQRGLGLPELPAAERAALSARLGRSLALAGRTGAARASLDQALELADGSAEVTGNAGIGLTDLGLTGQADDCLTTAARMTAGQPFIHALYVARLAKAALRARNPGLTAQRMTTLAALVPLVDSPRLTIHARHLVDGTRIWEPIPEVRDARDALHEVMA
jgi:transcriptional regulator with XRE-family HTH domain